MEGSVAIFARVQQAEIAVDGPVQRVVNEAVAAAALQELRFHVDAGWKFLLESDAPVERARGTQMTSVSGKGGRERRSYGKSVVIEEIISAVSGEGAGNQEQRGLIVDDAYAAGNFRVA